MQVTIDDGLRRKCPRVALGCVTASVEAPAAPAELVALTEQRVNEILKLPFPRGVLEAPEIVATRAAYKALGKDPARYRGSAEALLRRVVGGTGLPHGRWPADQCVAEIGEPSRRRAGIDFAAPRARQPGG